MKKLSAVFLAAVMTAVFVTPSFALLRKDLQSAKGTVTYVNPARTEFTIKDNNTGKDVSFTIPALNAAVVVGSPVVVLYKAGTTVAKTVRVVTPKKGAARTKAPVSYSSESSSNEDMPYTAPKSTTSSKKSSW